MVQIVEDESGQIHHFPDEATPQQIEEAFGLNKKNNPLMDKISYLLNQTLPSRNLAAGALSGIKSLGESLPNLKEMMPEGQIKNIYEKISPKTEFDPYEMMGVENQEMSLSPEYLQQRLGELIPYSLPIGQGASLIGKGIQRINPLKYSSKSIAENIGKKTKEMIAKYSGEEGLYTNLFKKARNEGVGKVKINPKEINLEQIKEYANPKYYESLEELLENPDITNAHFAQSDLKKYIQSMKGRSSIPSSEQKSLKAAKDALSNIQEKMFQGDKELKSEYEKITSGYKKEVIPYSKNKAIQNYLSGELLPKDLISSLKSNKKFMAVKGKEHPEFTKQELIKNILLNTGKWAVPSAAGGAIGAAIFDYLKNKRHY